MPETKLKPCTCEDWKMSMPQIIDAQLFAAKRIVGREYTGKQFTYCPWCGKKREQEIE